MNKELKACPYDIDTDIYEDRKNLEKITDKRGLEKRLKCAIKFIESSRHYDENEFQKTKFGTYESGKLMGRKELASDILTLIKYGEYPL